MEVIHFGRPARSRAPRQTGRRCGGIVIHPVCSWSAPRSARRCGAPPHDVSKCHDIRSCSGCGTGGSRAAPDCQPAAARPLSRPRSAERSEGSLDSARPSEGYPDPVSLAPRPRVAPVQPQPCPYMMVPARRVPDARARRARARGWITIPPPAPGAEQLAVAHVPAVGWITTSPPLKVDRL